MAARIFRINYKSDFIASLTSDAGWAVPFCIKFWTGAPTQAYYAQYDGETFTHCALDPDNPLKLLVQFDDHHLPVGDLKYQVAYHFTVDDFPNDTEDEVLNQADVQIEIGGDMYQVMLDFTGETAANIAFDLPAMANERQRQENELERIAHENARVAAEAARVTAEQGRVDAEVARVAAEQAREVQYSADHQQAVSDHQQASSDHTRADEDHTRAESDHTTAASDHTQAASDSQQAAQDHTRAESDHGIAVDDHTQAGNDHTRAESDHGIAVDDHTQAGNDHTRAESDHGIAADDHTQAGNDHTRAESDHTRAESDHAAVEVYVDSLGTFDISAYHATGGVLAKYADLTAALGTDGANIPDALRKGGMSVKFVLSSDNKYVQYRYMGTATTGSPNPFLNTDNWAICDNDILVDNPKFMEIEIDVENKILGGRKTDGTKFENMPLETPVDNTSYIDNEEWLDVETDNGGKIFGGLHKNGIYFFNRLSTKSIETDEVNIPKEGLNKLQEQLGTFNFVQGQTNIESIARLGYNIQSQDTPPENSIAGFIEAYKHHYRSMLADVRWTSDGIPVCLHSETINAVARNSNGTAIEGDVKLSDLTIEEVDGYDFGIVKGSKYAGLKILRLDEFVRWAKLMNIKPYLEIKDFSAANPEFTDEKWLSITSIIDKYGMQDRCAFILDFAYNQYVIPNAQKVHTKYPKSDICATRTNAQLTLDEECALWAQLKGTDNDVFWFIFNENVMTGNISNELIEASNAYGLSIGHTEIRTEAQVSEWLGDTNNLVCTRVAIRNKPINEFILKY